MANAAPPADASAPAQSQSRLRRLLRKAWWLHSGVALSFGVGVMLFARAGLAYADKVMIALFASWSIMFIALRFVVGPANRRDNEGLARRGIRVVTNYIIKQFYQQMFFFLTPLYASSATWSFQSANWWLPPILLVCAVVSTMDLVFDHFVMERRWLASMMYGLAMFGVINVLVPLVAGFDHITGLIIAAAATPTSVALLSFIVRQVLSPYGALLTVALTGGLLAAVWFGRAAIPPAPLAMPETTVGHSKGAPDPWECLPGSIHRIRRSELQNLRCGSYLREPGGIKEDIVHFWSHRGQEVVRKAPERLSCDGDGVVFRSVLTKDELPEDPIGPWTCTTRTVGGQLVGVRKFEVLTSDGRSVAELAGDAGPGSATGVGIGDRVGNGDRVGIGGRVGNGIGLRAEALGCPAARTCRHGRGRRSRA